MNKTTKIRHWYTDKILYEGEGSTREVVSAAAREGADLKDARLKGACLMGADLRDANLWGADFGGADLRGAKLQGADLMGACFKGADLHDANLKSAYLRDVDLSGADLRGANLRDTSLKGAYLHGADLQGADLAGAKLNWQSHALLSEILWRAATTEAQRMLAAYVGRATNWCWDSWQAWDHPEAEWARRELAKWVRPGDWAPQWIKSAVVESPEEEEDDE